MRENPDMEVAGTSGINTWGIFFFSFKIENSKYIILNRKKQNNNPRVLIF